MFVQLERAPEMVAADLEAVPGVARVETRLVEPATIPLEELPEPVRGAAVSLPQAPSRLTGGAKSEYRREMPILVARRSTRASLVALALAAGCPACGPEEIVIRDGAAQAVAAQPGGIELFLGDYVGVCDDLKGPGLRAGSRVVHLFLPVPSGAPPSDETYSVPPVAADFDPVQPPPEPDAAATSQVTGTVRITARTPSVIGAVDLDSAYQSGGKVHLIGDFTAAFCALPSHGG